MQLDFRSAIRLALDEELGSDPSVILFGEDIGAAGGAFAVTTGLQESYPDRVLDTPISELALSGAAFGAAVCGLRPVVEIMFGDFLPLAMDSLLNQASKFWYMSNGQSSVPLVVRCVVGAGGRFGPVHSQTPIAWFMSVPGMKIVGPSNPRDAHSLLRASIRDNNPVLFLEHKRLYTVKGEVDGRIDTVGTASVIQTGADITLVSALRGVQDCIEAAATLEQGGISVEVIDLRTLRPPDIETVVQSVRKTRRIMVVEEGPRTGGWAGEILASVTERCLESLKEAWRLTTPDHPVPYSPVLEDAFLPNAQSIVASVSDRLARGSVNA
jgi:acetoin:2,6-dichlorophenolindophenol oxidoreductase subunit beta